MEKDQQNPKMLHIEIDELVDFGLFVRKNSHLNIKTAYFQWRELNKR